MRPDQIRQVVVQGLRSGYPPQQAGSGGPESCCSLARATDCPAPTLRFALADAPFSSRRADSYPSSPAAPGQSPLPTESPGEILTPSQTLRAYPSSLNGQSKYSLAPVDAGYRMMRG